MKEPNWLGLERMIAKHLLGAGIPVIAEHRDLLSPDFRQGADPGPGFLPYDFILPGRIPTIIEVKYATFGNIDYTKKLAATVAQAFSRFRIVLIVVGSHSASWETVRPYVSGLFYLDLTDIPKERFESVAGLFVEEVFGHLGDLPVQSSGDLPVESPRKSPELDEVPPLTQLFPDEIQKAIETVTYSFSAIVSGDDPAMQVVGQELNELMKEFTSNHFTSCALRIGRCLEFTVYAFAHRIGVNPQTGRHRIILNARKQLKNVDSKMQDLAPLSKSDDSDLFIRTKKQVVKAIQDLQGHLTQLVSDLEDMEEEREEAEPDNIQGILCRSQKQLDLLGAPNEAKRRLGRIQGKEKVDDILKFRNKAAHGDPRLESGKCPKKKS